MKSMLYSQPMVKAILSGNKDRTRRVVKLPEEILPLGEKAFCYLSVDKKWVFDPSNGTGMLADGIKPKFEVGETFYVKETFYAYGRWDKDGLAEDGRQKWTFSDMTLEKGLKHLHYDTILTVDRGKDNEGTGWHKRPAIFMPFCAARIFLTVTGVGAERLHSIDQADAIQEGIEMDTVRIDTDEETGIETVWRDYLQKRTGIAGFDFRNPQASFRSLWISINGAQSWEENPFVWIYVFKKTQYENLQ